MRSIIFGTRRRVGQRERAGFRRAVDDVFRGAEAASDALGHMYRARPGEDHVAHRLEALDPDAAGALEVVEREACQSVARGALVRRVAVSFRTRGFPCRSVDRVPPEEAGRVDDVRPRGTCAREGGSPRRTARAPPQAGAGSSAPGRAARPAGVGRRHASTRWPRLDEPVGELGRVTRRPADVRRPDPRDDDHLHGHRARVAGVCARGSRARRSRRRAKTTVEISAATAAPVASHFEPNARTSGTTTIVSIPCVTIRSSGCPPRRAATSSRRTRSRDRAGEQHQSRRVGRGHVLSRTRAGSGPASPSRRAGPPRPSPEREGLVPVQAPRTPGPKWPRLPVPVCSVGSGASGPR